MDKNDIKQRIDSLVKELRKHNYYYYVLDKPIISDFEYDKLYNELKSLEEKYPDLINKNSPTLFPGYKILDTFNTYKHKIPMLSLDNTYNQEQIIEFDSRIQKTLKTKDYTYVCDLKIDGAAVSLIYIDGKLQKGVTRGDGKIGEDITENIKFLKNIPKFIPIKNEIEIRGEVYIPKKEFIKLNQKREEKGKSIFANPRNAASGSLRVLDTSITASRPLFFFPHTAGYIETEKNYYKTQIELLDFFKQLGFNIEENFSLCKDIQEVIKYCDIWQNKKNNLNYEIDGIVIKINEIDKRLILGSTSKYPRWAIAYKFKPDIQQTILKEVIFQVGRTGVITPVAIFDEIFLAGSKVKRATLHNMEEIQRLGIKINDVIEVHKAGDIIPKVIGVIKHKRKNNTKAILIPEKCPSCNKKLLKLPDEVALRCNNLNCPAQIKRRIEYFCSRDCMDIEGMGKANVETFVENNFLKGLVDIYYLHKHKAALEKLEGFGNKKVTKILDAIEKSKTRPLSKFIAGLGISDTGVVAAELIAKKVKTFKNFINLTTEHLEEIDGIGEKTSFSVMDFIKNNKKQLNEFLNLNLNFKEPVIEIPVEDQIFKNKIIVITGVLPGIDRKSAENKIKLLGGKTTSSVSKKTDIVIVGDNPGSKYEKAKKLNIKIMDKNQFLKLIK